MKLRLLDFKLNSIETLVLSAATCNCGTHDMHPSISVTIMVPDDLVPNSARPSEAIELIVTLVSQKPLRKNTHHITLIPDSSLLISLLWRVHPVEATACDGRFTFSVHGWCGGPRDIPSEGRDAGAGGPECSSSHEPQ